MTTPPIVTTEQVQGDFTIAVADGADRYVPLPSREQKLETFARVAEFSVVDAPVPVLDPERARDFAFRWGMASVPFTPWHGFGGYDTRTGSITLA